MQYCYLQAVKLSPLKSASHFDLPIPSLATHLKAMQISYVPASPFPLNFQHLSRTSFCASSCCNIWYQYISDGCQIMLLVFSSLTTFPCYSRPWIQVRLKTKTVFLFYRRSMHAFYLVSNSSCVLVVYLDLLSRPNTQRAGHVRLFLV